MPFLVIKDEISKTLGVYNKMVLEVQNFSALWSWNCSSGCIFSAGEALINFGEGALRHNGLGKGEFWHFLVLK